MKKGFKVILAGILSLCALLSTGCFVTKSQTMKDVQGTYKLSCLLREEKVENASGVKEDVSTDEIEKYGLEVYLVVTGENIGYYAYKSNAKSARVSEVQLTYTLQAEKTDEYQFVSLTQKRFSDEKADEIIDKATKFGITKNGLNYTKPIGAAEYQVNWKKVDKATDLSYVKEKFGADVPTYSYDGYAVRGGYKVDFYAPSKDNQGNDCAIENPYSYYYLVLDTASMQATTYYALKSDTANPVKETKSITLVDGGWDKIKIGDEEWTFHLVSYTRSFEMAGATCKLNSARVAIENAAAWAEEEIAALTQSAE